MEWIRLDHLGESYCTLVRSYDSEEAARDGGVTMDTERFLRVPREPW